MPYYCARAKICILRPSTRSVGAQKAAVMECVIENDKGAPMTHRAVVEKQETDSQKGVLE